MKQMNIFHYSAFQMKIVIGIAFHHFNDDAENVWKNRKLYLNNAIPPNFIVFHKAFRSHGIEFMTLFVHVGHFMFKVFITLDCATSISGTFS